MGNSGMKMIVEKIKDITSADVNLRKFFIDNPKQAIKEKFNVTVPDGVELKVVEETAGSFYIVLPPVIGEDKVNSW